MTLRVGIMSANWGAFAHLPAWRSVPGVEVVRGQERSAVADHLRQRAGVCGEDRRCGLEHPVNRALACLVLAAGKVKLEGAGFAGGRRQLPQLNGRTVEPEQATRAVARVNGKRQHFYDR